MKNEFKSALDAVFDRRDEEKRRAAEARAAAQTKAENNLDQFLSLRDNVIRPSFEECASYLKERGFEAEIRDVEHSQDDIGRRIEPSITLHFYSGRRTGTYDQIPHLRATGSVRDGTVRFHMSTMTPNTGGQSGPCGSFPMSQVTTDLVQERFVHVMTTMFPKR